MQKKRKNNSFLLIAIETLFGAWVGTVVGNDLSTTYDVARHDKIKASDYKDWWEPW